MMRLAFEPRAQERQIAPMLVLQIAVVTEVIDRHRTCTDFQAGARAQRLEVGKHGFVNDAAKAQVGAIAKQPVFAIARVAGRGPKQYGIANVPGVGEQRLDAGAIELHDAFVRVDVQDPRSARSGDGRVSRGREIIGPDVVQYTGAQIVGDFARTIGRSGVDDDDLVDTACKRPQATFEEALLVADDQCCRKQRTGPSEYPPNV